MKILRNRPSLPTRRNHRQLLGAACAVLCGALAVGASSPANACSPGEELWGAVPESGSPLAAGSRLYLENGYSAGVTVDGVAASLVRDEQFPAGQGFWDAYLVEPAPAVGSTVVVDGEYSWTVTAPDTDAPKNAASLEFGTYDHRNVDTFDTCWGGGPMEATVYIRATVPEPDASGTPRLALVELLDATTDQIVVSELHEPSAISSGALETKVGIPEGILDGPLQDAVCVQITLIDLAGLRSEPVRTCAPHHVVSDDDGTDAENEHELPDEPAWGDDDDADDDDDDPDADGDGGGCRVGARPPSWALAFALLALGLRRRRNATPLS